MERDGAKGKRPKTNLLKELLPCLEKEYALTDDRDQRTIMGFSMGAAGSLYWGPKYLDLFSTAVALDADEVAPTSSTQRPEITCPSMEKNQGDQGILDHSPCSGGLNTTRFRQSLDKLKTSYDYAQLPRDISRLTRPV
jgi:hypothetical protein